MRAVVILAQELVRDEKGQPMTGRGSFYLPNDYVLNLARFTGIVTGGFDSSRAAGCVGGTGTLPGAGAVMMKCLPNCHNINCNDRRFTRFWERMAEARLPLLAHTGGEHTLPVVRPEYRRSANIGASARVRRQGHCRHCATKSGLIDPEYFHVFAEMTRQWPKSLRRYQRL